MVAVASEENKGVSVISYDTDLCVCTPCTSLCQAEAYWGSDHEII